MLTSRSEYLDLPDVRLHIRRWGNPKAPTLFMLHGWMDVSASLQFVVDELERDWNIIAPDWRGFGLSDWLSRPYFFAEHIGDLEAILERYAGVRPREVWAWASYDFANSGYTTVVITALFNAYFVAVVAGRAPWATFAWTAALSVSYALIVLTAPVIGAWADAHGAKKRVLLFSTIGCVAGTAALGLAGPGDLAIAVIALVVSNFFFGTGENIIAAFLPELGKSESLGKISGWGWAFGYLGGLVALGACLGYVTWAQGQGHEAAQFVPVTMLITAALFVVASLPDLPRPE
jgi:pimeloyl-ACP methyl ester carboxylesterase